MTVDPTKMEHSPQLLRMFLFLKVCNLMKFLFQVIASVVYDSDAFSKHEDSRLDIYLAYESKLNSYVFSTKILYIILTPLFIYFLVTISNNHSLHAVGVSMPSDQLCVSLGQSLCPQIIQCYHLTQCCK